MPKRGNRRLRKKKNNVLIITAENQSEQDDEQRTYSYNEQPVLSTAEEVYQSAADGVEAISIAGAGIETIRAAVEDIGPSVEAVSAAVEAIRASVETSGARVEADGAHVAAGGAPLEAMLAAVEADEANVESIRVYVAPGGESAENAVAVVEAGGADLEADRAGVEAAGAGTEDSGSGVETGGVGVVPGSALIEVRGDAIEPDAASMEADGAINQMTALDESQLTFILDQITVTTAELAVIAQGVITNEETAVTAGSPAPKTEQDAYDKCEYCELSVLPKKNSKENILKRKIHRIACRSNQQICNICFEIVSRKSTPKSRQFGLLENCTHAFCADCLYKWRRTGTVPITVRKSCPVCRAPSKAVYMSPFWTECQISKKIIMENFKNACAKKPCKFFRNGKGICPFADRCFYRHKYESEVWNGSPCPSVFEFECDNYSGVMQHFLAYNRSEARIQWLRERDNPSVREEDS